MHHFSNAGVFQMGKIANPIGYLEAIFGSMFSGKTDELFKRLGRERAAGSEILLFVHRSNSIRDGDGIVRSHNNAAFGSILANTTEEIDEIVRRKLSEAENGKPIIVGIDEAQFLSGNILKTSVALTLEGVNIILAALDSDFTGKPWETMIPVQLFPGCHKTFMYAICTHCHNGHGARQRRPARWSKKCGGNKEERLEIGGEDLYVAACDMCHGAYEEAAINTEKWEI